MNLKSPEAKKTYFSDRLKARLKEVPQAGLTWVTAPAGYGKTTAVLRSLPGPRRTVLYQAILSSFALQFWEDFCHLWTGIDPDRARSLLSVGLPNNPVSNYQSLQLLRGLALDQETFVVLDDYHWIEDPDLHRFLVTLVLSRIPRLHLVVVSRNEGFPGLDELVVKGQVEIVDRSVLELHPGDILQYFAQSGVLLTPDQAEALFRKTDGWISALCLTLLKGKLSPDFLQRTKELSFQGGTLANLLESAVFAPLAPPVRDLLLAVSPFDSFSLGLAAALCPGTDVQAGLQDLQTRNAFLFYDAGKDVYRLHSIFLSYLRQRFQTLDDEEKKAVFARAAEWYQGNRDYWAAMESFFGAGLQERVLQTMETDQGVSITADMKDRLIQLFDGIPGEVRRRHPRALLIFLRRMYLHQEFAVFGRYCALFHEAIATTPMAEAERNELLGEFELVLSFTKYNDIGKMSEHHRKALDLLKGPSKTLGNGVGWTFGSPSVLYMFHREPGRLDDEVRTIRESMPFYYALTGNHGWGAEEVMAAEQLFLTGNLEDSEILAHRVLDQVKDTPQGGLALCAAFLLARLALFRGDLPEILRLFSQMREDLERNRCYIQLHTLDVCEAFIFSRLGALDRAPAWIVQGDFRNTRLMAPAHGFLNMMYGRVLLTQGNYLKLLGSYEAFCKTASVFPNLVALLMAHIHKAAALLAIHRRDEAQAALILALELAEPDGLVVPFVEHARDLGLLLKGLAGTKRWASFLEKAEPLAARYEKSLETIAVKYFPEKSPGGLTPRESEIAALAARNLTTPQIADQLGISANTVKTILKTVFEKLKVKSRVQLEEALRGQGR